MTIEARRTMVAGWERDRPEITHVEIHHDKTNVASAGVPRKLGFAFIGEFPDDAKAPAETGISCHWRMDRERWRETHSQRSAGAPGPNTIPRSEKGGKTCRSRRSARTGAGNAPDPAHNLDRSERF